MGSTTAPSTRTTHDEDGLGDALRRVPPLLPVFAVLFLIVTGLGLLLTHALDGVTAWDTDVLRRLAESRTDTVDTLTEYGTWLAETVTSIAVLLVALVVARLVSHGWTLSVFLAVAVASEKLIYLVSSVLVNRERPPVPTVGTTYATSSFPSGHVGTAITLYGGIALVVGALSGSRALRNGLLVVTGVIAAVVAYCRLYRGFHFPTDVMVGAAVGTTCLAVSWLGIGRFAPSNRLHPSEDAGLELPWQPVERTTAT
jgi:undecaprenyl-diphosphatase